MLLQKTGLVSQHSQKKSVSIHVRFSKLLHVGVNNASEEAAASDSAKIRYITWTGCKSWKQLYVCWFSYRNDEKIQDVETCGHIAIQTNYLARAMYHLEKRGFVFDESSFKYDAKGNITVAYLKDEIAGFAVHFNQK